MIGFCPLASGSRGNALFLGSKKTKVLIDAGISYKRVEASLFSIEVNAKEIEAVLITHEHTDHISGLKSISSALELSVFANPLTAKGICEALSFRPKFKLFSTNEPFFFKDLKIFPFSIQHDSVDPVGFVIEMEGVKIGICADLGIATSFVRSYLKECDVLYVEANHQPSMVHASPRSSVYKERVLSRQGHLSNEECAELILSVANGKLRKVYLAHLSSECNSKELASKIVKESVHRRFPNVEIVIAHQEKISEPFYLDV